MEPLVMTTSTLCVVLLTLLTPSASLQIHVQTGNIELQHSLPALPRKLKLFEITVKGYGSGQDHFHSYDRHYKEHVAGKSSKVDKEQVVVHGSKGSTWQEWMDEGADTSEFHTMDYSQVRRRRPVHNKSMPVGP